MTWLVNTVSKQTSQKDYDKLKNAMMSLKNEGLKLGMREEEIQSIVQFQFDKHCNKRKYSCWKFFMNFNFALFLLIMITLSSIILNGKDFKLNRCILENNYLVMEVTRPITNCNICKGINSFIVLENVTKEMFAKYAYLGHPLLVKGGCMNWTALDLFDFEFFKNLYSTVDGAHKSVEDECQFFPFRTTFLSLQEVFNMSENRAKMTSNAEETWYIGWSNCNPDISNILRQHYSKPNFLPDDSEVSAIDWIFMGYRGTGASMHLDYVRRPSWQAQIKGKKSWYLLPPPECEEVCTSLNITVDRGDIILVDTNQWYHTTFIEGEEMSVTLGSEYD